LRQGNGERAHRGEDHAEMDRLVDWVPAGCDD
jgi:hypothetical protein